MLTSAGETASGSASSVLAFYHVLPGVPRDRYRDVDVDATDQSGLVLNPGRPMLLVGEFREVIAPPMERQVGASLGECLATERAGYGVRH